MSQRLKNWLAFAAGGTIPLAVLAVLLLGIWVQDIRDDRRHTVIVNGSTPVFVGSGDEDREKRPQLTTVKRGSKLPVQRIRYEKNCATLDVVLPDGRRGYVVLGAGDVSVQPPLPRL